MAIGLDASKALGLRGPTAMQPVDTAQSKLLADPNYVQTQERIKKDRSELDAAQTKYDTGIKPIKDQYEAGVKDLEGMKFEPPPVPQEFKPEKPDPKQQQDFMSNMMMFAVVGGLMTRAPLTAALNGFAGAMEGFHAGNLEKFKQDKAVFDTNFKVAQEKSREYVEKFRATFENKKLSLAEKMNQWKMLDTEYQHTTGMLHHDMQDARGLITQMENVAKGTDAAERQYRQQELQFQRMEASMRRQEAAAARAAQPHAPVGYRFTKDGNLEFIPGGPHDPSSMEKINQVRAEAKAKAAAVGGGKPMTSIQSTLYEDVATGYFRLGKLEEMAKQTGNLPGGSIFLQDESKTDGLFSAIKNYGKTASLPTGYQQSDALLLGIAFDVASARSGGRGQLSDSKIREVTKQMPLASDSQETRALKYELLKNQLETANHTLPKQYQYDPAKGGPAGEAQPSNEGIPAGWSVKVK
jgi:hypothetical protein